MSGRTEHPSPDFVELTITYGECSGYCTTVLRVEGTQLVLTRISNDEAASDIQVSGNTDAEWASRIRQAIESIRGASLETVYGKPDSRDEGAATIRVARNGVMSDHTYSATDPPLPLVELHLALDQILHAWIEGEDLPGISFESRPLQ